jgi:hypothetical protein
VCVCVCVCVVCVYSTVLWCGYCRLRFQEELKEWDTVAAQHSRSEGKIKKGSSSNTGRRRSSRAAADALSLDEIEVVALFMLSDVPCLASFSMPRAIMQSDAIEGFAAEGSDIISHDEYRRTAEKTAMQLAHVSKRLTGAKATLTTTDALVRSASLDLRADLFLNLPGDNPKALLARGAPPLASTADAERDAGSKLSSQARSTTRIREPPARTPRQPGHGDAAAEDTVVPLTSAPRTKSSSKKDKAFQVAQDEDDDDSDRGRPSVPDATPRILGKIKRGKRA